MKHKAQKLSIDILLYFKDDQNPIEETNVDILKDIVGVEKPSRYEIVSIADDISLLYDTITTENGKDIVTETVVPIPKENISIEGTKLSIHMGEAPNMLDFTLDLENGSYTTQSTLHRSLKNMRLSIKMTYELRKTARVSLKTPTSGGKE